jgi:WD40 repeat protein
MMGTLITKLKAGLVLALAMGTFAAGAHRARAAKGPETKQEAEAKPEADKQPARTDRYGDPLPAGALVRLGTTRLRHGQPNGVRCLGFFPDGKTLLSADWHGVNVWDAATGKLLRRFGDPRGRQFQSVAFSQGGRTVALSIGEGGIDVWDATTGRRLDAFPTGRFPLVELSPDGKTLAVLDHDERDRPSLRLLDTAGGLVRHRLTGHEGTVHRFIFSADGKTLISAGEDKTIRFWDVATGKEVRRLVTAEPVVQIAVAPDGKALASVGTVKAEGAKGPMRFTYWKNGDVVLWDLLKAKETHRLKGHDTNVAAALAFTPDGRSLVSCDWSSTHWWDVGLCPSIEPMYTDRGAN